MSRSDITIWNQQATFLFIAEFRAKNLFSKLAKGLKPSVFLIGISIGDRENRKPICLGTTGLWL